MTQDHPPIRVLLVEDSDVYRDSLVFLLRRVDGIDVVGALAVGAHATQACRDTEAEVVVIDFRLPDVDGAEVAAGLRSDCPDAAVVFLSASAGQDDYDAAASAGAALVRKDDGVAALVNAVRAAAGR